MKDMLDKILQIEKKYNELGVTLSDPAVIQDYNKFRDLSKQRKSMEETVNLYYDWKKAVDAIEEAKEMIHNEHDEEMKNFLKAGKETLRDWRTGHIIRTPRLQLKLLNISESIISVIAHSQRNMNL